MSEPRRCPVCGSELLIDRGDGRWQCSRCAEPLNEPDASAGWRTEAYHQHAIEGQDHQ